MTKLTFQQLLLWSSVSHDASEIILIYYFGAKKNIYFYYQIFKTDGLRNIFVEAIIHFSGFFDEYRKFKRTAISVIYCMYICMLIFF